VYCRCSASLDCLHGFCAGFHTEGKPTIVVLQGSCQTSAVYQKLKDGLEGKGYSVFCPALPSCIGTESPDFPKVTLSDDAASVLKVLVPLIERESKLVVVVMHSYGGLVGSEAVTEDLSFFWRRQQGLEGGVIHLYYFTAFVLPKGASVLGTFGESPNSELSVSTTRPTAHQYIMLIWELWHRAMVASKIRNASKINYSDLPEAEAES
jgi:pimeloyl-ACP methyl ester carboxylesterase